MAKDLGKVEQSPADDRSYRALELDNGLQASMLGLGREGGDWGFAGGLPMMMVSTLCVVGLVGCHRILWQANFLAGTFCNDCIYMAGGPPFRGRL